MVLHTSQAQLAIQGRSAASRLCPGQLGIEIVTEQLAFIFMHFAFNRTRLVAANCHNSRCRRITQPVVSGYLDIWVSGYLDVSKGGLAAYSTDCSCFVGFVDRVKVSA